MRPPEVPAGSTALWLCEMGIKREHFNFDSPNLSSSSVMMRVKMARIGIGF